MTAYQIQLALPLFVMALLSFTIIIVLGVSRFRAAHQHKLDAKFYKLYRGDGEPDDIRKISRNFQNLFETPILFYVAILAALILNIQSVPLLYLVWSYALLRCFHSYVHCTSNKVILRFKIFLVSLLVLVSIWMLLLVNILRQL